MAKNEKAPRDAAGVIAARIDDFIGWMESSGMIGRWERKKELAGVKRNLRRLNGRIQETEPKKTLKKEKR
jgi:hypothetical protein